MDGASLSVLAAVQTLNATGSTAPACAPPADLRDSFAAILGATELTGLSADQQAALTQLLAGPSGKLPPAADAAGKELPQAAIRGLLGALGIALDPQASATEAVVPPPGAAVGAQEASTPDDGADLAATLLAMLLQGNAGTDGSALRPAPVENDSGSADTADGLVIEMALPFAAMLPATESAATVAQVSADAERPAGLDAFWAMIRQAGGSLGTADGAQPRATAAADGSATPQSESGGLSLPTKFLAAVEAVAGAVGADAPPIAELSRGLANALDAVSSGAGRSGLAAAPEIVPPRVAAPASDTLSVPVGERGWDRALGERVLWLVGQQVQAAEVKLNPPHLGPVEVRLALTGQDATVSFTVAHGTTRDAIEQAIPRLRELFAEHQLQIVNVDVGQRDASSHASQGDRSGQGGTLSAGAGESAAALAAEPAVAIQRTALPGLVDEYV